MKKSKTPTRVTAQEVRDALQSDVEETYLVCAYETESKFQAAPLAGAISMPRFLGKLKSVPKDASIVFY